MKKIFLTFDDGPCSPSSQDTMKEMLKTLKNLKVPATFFLIGNKITSENAEVIKQAFSEGHSIQNHSWTHSHMKNWSVDQIKNEFQKTDEAIFKIIGKHTSFFRPPYLETSENMYKAINADFIFGEGCPDWEESFTTEKRVSAILNQAKENQVILLHVMENNWQTVEAVKILVPELLKQNYTFKSLEK